MIFFIPYFNDKYIPREVEHKYSLLGLNSFKMFKCNIGNNIISVKTLWILEGVQEVAKGKGKGWGCWKLCFVDNLHMIFYTLF